VDLALRECWDWDTKEAKVEEERAGRNPVASLVCCPFRWMVPAALPALAPLLVLDLG
jgi:hypothetical protein